MGGSLFGNTETHFGCINNDSQVGYVETPGSLVGCGRVGRLTDWIQGGYIWQYVWYPIVWYLFSNPASGHMFGIVDSLDDGWPIDLILN
jgi:hypothetical protein